MGMNDISKKVSLVYNKTKNTIVKHSPEIYLGVGIVTSIAGAVFAYKAKPKVDAVVADTKKNFKLVEDTLQNKDISEKQYSQEDANKDKYIICVKAGVDIAKELAPAIIFEAVSIASFLMSHNIIKKRNTALAIAFSALDKKFKLYRTGVKDRYGENVDNEILHGLKAIKITEKEVDPETGEVTKSKKESSEIVEKNPFTFYIDSSSSKIWTDDPFAVRTLINAEQNWANDVLAARRIITLNEVLDALGLDRTAEGQYYGWYADNPEGDGYVDFRPVETTMIVDGKRETVFAMDFNCDGPIVDYIPLGK